MGTPSGPDLANFFGLHYEFKHLDNLVALAKRTGEGDELTRRTALEECRSLRFYVRFIDDMLNFNNVHFQKILNSYPSAITFTKAGEGRGVQGVAFMDAFIYQMSAAPHRMLIKLFDKRRGRQFSHLQIIQYTHWESFLPASIKLNILTGQFHRFTRLITDEHDFHIELASVLYKLIIICCMPRRRLILRLRDLLFNPHTRYVHGDPPHQPGYHFHKILWWLRFGEQHGLQELLSQTQWTPQMRVQPLDSYEAEPAAAQQQITVRRSTRIAARRGGNAASTQST
jgi:hypothetical protein